MEEKICFSNYPTCGDDQIECVCGTTYCLHCYADEAHTSICDDNFHIRTKNAIEFIEKGNIPISAIRTKRRCLNSFNFCRDGVLSAKINLFPHIIPFTGSSKGCLTCGKKHNQLYRLAHVNKTLPYMYQYSADLCHDCAYNKVFICSATYLPSNKCGRKCWLLAQKIFVEMCLLDLPLDVVKYIYHYVLLLNPDSKIIGLNIPHHECKRHFDIQIC